MRRNATESILLQLPRELRDRIYEQVFGGGRILHIHRFGRYPNWLPSRLSRLWGLDTSESGSSHDWVTSLCVTHNIDSADYGFRGSSSVDALSQSSHGSGSRRLCPLRSIHNLSDHASDEDLFSTAPPTPSQRNPIDLRLLRVCRQVYQEANPLLWRTPVFSFTEATSMKDFLNYRTTAQRRQIQKLHIHHHAVHIDLAPLSHKWQDLERLPFIRPLEGLKEVRLTLILSVDPPTSTPMSQNDLDASIMEHTLKPFVNLRYHSLQKITLLIQYHDIPDHLQPDLTSDSWRARVADQLKALMLDPNGRQLCEEEHARQLEDRNIAAKKRLSETRMMICFHRAADCKAHMQRLRDSQDARALKDGRTVRHRKPVTPCKRRHICCDDYDCSCAGEDPDSSDEEEPRSTIGEDDTRMLDVDDLLHLQNGMLVLGEHD